MKLVNLLFEDDYEDVDILSVPNYIADNIVIIVQQFFDWMDDINNTHNYRKVNENGTTTLEIGTEAFVWWLNNFCVCGNDVVSIIVQHTDYCPDYPVAEF